MKSLGAEVAKDEDEIVVPKRSKASAKTSLGSGDRAGSASPPMRRLMRIAAGVGIALGGVVTLFGVMAVVGLAVENIWVRLVVGLLVVVGLPGLLADRLLKRSDATLATRGALGTVADVFAIVLLGIALTIVAADAVSSSLLKHEGDLYARHGSTTMARIVYFVAGVSPTFPADKAGANGPTPGGSASGSSGASAAVPGSAAPPPSK